VGVVEAPVSLTTLAVGIVAEHRAALSASRSALHHAKRAGELLLEAKTQVRHGEWMQWLGANCDLTIRVAQIYMQIARGWPDIETVLNAYPNTHLTITEARALVANTDDEQDENDTDDDPDEDELGTGGCGGGAGTGTGSTTNTNAQTQIVYLVSTVATVAAIRQQVNELAAEYGIEATNWTDRLFAVIARTHALVVRRCR
jgi:hypothetical protein